MSEKFEFVTQKPFGVSLSYVKQFQESTAKRREYVERAARFARKVFNRLSESDDYSHSHDSFAVRDALLATEFFFPDLGTFGAEYIREGKNSRSPAIDYLNTGDSYGLTVLYVKGQFRAGNWGDYVERGNYE